MIDIDVYLEKFYAFCDSQNLIRLMEPIEFDRVTGFGTVGDFVACSFEPVHCDFESTQWQPAMQSIVQAVRNHWGGRYYMLDVYQKEDGSVFMSASLVKKGVRPLKKKVRMKRWWEREESE